MKNLLITLSLTFVSTAAFADMNACAPVLEKQFDRFEILTAAQAQVMGQAALAEGEADDKAEFLALTEEPDLLFFIAEWTVPGNTGTTLLALDARTCLTLVDVLYSSEE